MSQRFFYGSPLFPFLVDLADRFGRSHLSYSRLRSATSSPRLFFPSRLNPSFLFLQFVCSPRPRPFLFPSDSISILPLVSPLTTGFPLHWFPTLDDPAWSRTRSFVLHGDYLYYVYSRFFTLVRVTADGRGLCCGCTFLPTGRRFVRPRAQGARRVAASDSRRETVFFTNDSGGAHARQRLPYCHADLLGGGGHGVVGDRDAENDCGQPPCRELRDGFAARFAISGPLFPRREDGEGVRFQFPVTRMSRSGCGLYFPPC